MKNNGMLSKAVKLLSSIKTKITGADRFGDTDSAVLKVAMMIAALDGDVTQEELGSFAKLARQCRGYSAEEADRVMDEGLRSAGYLVLQAKRLGEKKLLDAFVAEADAAMPGGFAVADAADVRRAFVMWTAMAMSDDDYSDVERKALAAFRKHLDAIAETVNAYNDSRRSAYSPAFARAFVLEEKEFKFKSATTDAFMEKAEKLIAKLNREATAEAAAQELKDLIVKG